MPKRQLPLTSVYDYNKLVEAFLECGIKEMFVHKLYSWLSRHPDCPWAAVPDLPRAAVALLETSFQHCTSRLVAQQVSADGETSKLLLELQDGLQVEAVIMVYDTRGRGGVECNGGSGQRRATLCVSSQVGCQMGCTFCATGTMGLKGDLTCGEIVEQLVHARRVTHIRNVVFMGMGEPLNNYGSVCAAVRMMTDSRYWALRQSAVTVSTVGVIPRIQQLATDLPGVSLALSLHAPNQELRQRIVPSARAYKLDRLMEALADYQANAKNDKVFVEYVLLAGVNDTLECAHQLGRLLQGRRLVVNLIPWNPVYSPGQCHAAPEPADVAAFQSLLRCEYGLQCTVRQEKGQDIAGACGQLVVEVGRGSCGSPPGMKKDLRDIEELVSAPLTPMVK